MSEPARIVDRWRDGLMDAAEEQAVAARLAADAVMRTAVLAECRQQWELDALLAEDRADAGWRRVEEGLSWVAAEPRPAWAAVERRLARRRHGRRLRLPWLAAALAAGLLLAVLVARHGAGPALQVDTCAGAIVRERGPERMPLAAGMTLRADDRLRTGDDGQAGLLLSDGSRLDLEHDAALVWDGDAGFRLDQGAVTVQARPRAAERPLTVTTPQATATVVGTRFRVEHRADRSHLAVTEGSVRFATADTPGQLVRAGEAVHGPTPVEPGWRLLWADEFDRDGAPDAERWEPETGFVRNQELQCYQAANASVRDGLLVIEARREPVANPRHTAGSRDWRFARQQADYTSASLRLKDRWAWTYGRCEIRARVPVQAGLWPALWTWGVARPWPWNGEVDIMQCYRLDGVPHLLANARWDEKTWSSARLPLSRFTARDPGWAERFHLWRMDWDADTIRLSVDGEVLNVIDVAQARNTDGSLPFRSPQALILSLAVGSNGGDPSTTTFPVRFAIDHIRVYQRTTTGR